MYLAILYPEHAEFIRSTTARLSVLTSYDLYELKKGVKEKIRVETSYSSDLHWIARLIEVELRRRSRRCLGLSVILFFMVLLILMVFTAIMICVLFPYYRYRFDADTK